jgi:hypothetical protein
MQRVWVIDRGPGFFVVVWFGYSTTPSPTLTSKSCLSFSVFLCVARRAYCQERRVGEGSLILRRLKIMVLYNTLTQRILNDLQRARLSRPSYDLAPSPSPDPNFGSKLSLILNLSVCVAVRTYWPKSGGTAPKSYDCKKARFSIIHPILSASTEPFADNLEVK